MGHLLRAIEATNFRSEAESDLSTARQRRLLGSL
jgi:hypothetical protein